MSVFNTAPLVQKAYSTISDSNTISFTLSLDPNARFYSIVLLNDTQITNQPFYYGYIYCSSTEDVMIPVTQQEITSTSYDNSTTTISFVLDSTFSGTYSLSYTRND